MGKGRRGQSSREWGLAPSLRHGTSFKYTCKTHTPNQGWQLCEMVLIETILNFYGWHWASLKSSKKKEWLHTKKRLRWKDTEMSQLAVNVWLGRRWRVKTTGEWACQDHILALDVQGYHWVDWMLLLKLLWPFDTLLNCRVDFPQEPQQVSSGICIGFRWQQGADNHQGSRARKGSEAEE